jgi:hypothetical protein
MRERLGNAADAAAGGCCFVTLKPRQRRKMAALHFLLKGEDALWRGCWHGKASDFEQAR